MQPFALANIHQRFLQVLQIVFGKVVLVSSLAVDWPFGVGLRLYIEFAQAVDYDVGKGQIFCYILFAIGIMAFGKCSKSIVFMISVISLWIYIGITLGRSIINDAWYDTLMLFPFGVLLAINEKAFIDITKSHT